MKKIFTSTLIILILTAFFIAGYKSNKTTAAAPIGFGGHLIWSMPCTCGFVARYMYYAPQPDSPFPGGPLSYVLAATIVYKFYNMLTPGVWHLGQYAPGVQSCWMYGGTSCYPMLVLGTEIQVGTSAVPTPFN